MQRIKASNLSSLAWTTARGLKGTCTAIALAALLACILLAGCAGDDQGDSLVPEEPASADVSQEAPDSALEDPEPIPPRAELAITPLQAVQMARAILPEGRWRLVAVSSFGVGFNAVSQDGAIMPSSGDGSARQWHIEFMGEDRTRQLLDEDTWEPTAQMGYPIYLVTVLDGIAEPSPLFDPEDYQALTEIWPALDENAVATYAHAWETASRAGPADYDFASAALSDWEDPGLERLAWVFRFYDADTRDMLVSVLTDSTGSLIDVR